MKIGIVIINYCGAADTIECIDSLLATQGVRKEIYLLDNASPDESGSILQQHYSGQRDVHVQQMETNVGFGAASNLGATLALRAQCTHIVLLNNDTVVDQEMLRFLADASDENTVTAPIMYYYSNPERIWFGGGYFDTYGIPRHEGFGRIDSGMIASHSIEFATGCCMLIPRHVWEMIGGFDEAFFLYWEDVDLSIRMKRQNVDIELIPKAKLWHKSFIISRWSKLATCLLL
jgi:Predicted glycosyltransferases